MNYWLVKSEPSTYGWEQLVKDKKTTWDGVRNYAARIHLRSMKKGMKSYFITVMKEWKLLVLQRLIKKLTRTQLQKIPIGWRLILSLIKN